MYHGPNNDGCQWPIAFCNQDPTTYRIEFNEESQMDELVCDNCIDQWFWIEDDFECQGCQSLNSDCFNSGGECFEEDKDILCRNCMPGSWTDQEELACILNIEACDDDPWDYFIDDDSNRHCNSCSDNKIWNNSTLACVTCESFNHLCNSCHVEDLGATTICDSCSSGAMP